MQKPLKKYINFGAEKYNKQKKKLLEGFNNSSELAENRINKIEYKLLEMINSGNKTRIRKVNKA